MSRDQVVFVDNLSGKHFKPDIRCIPRFGISVQKYVDRTHSKLHKFRKSQCSSVKRFSTSVLNHSNFEIFLIAPHEVGLKCFSEKLYRQNLKT